MNPPTRKLLFAIIACWLVAGSIALLTYRGMHSLTQALAYHSENGMHLDHLRRLQLAFADYEAANRRFLNTGSERFLGDVQSSRIALASALQTVNAYTGGTDQEKALRRQLAEVLAQTISLDDNLIDLRRKQGPQAALDQLRTGESLAINGRLRTIAQELNQLGVQRLEEHVVVVRRSTSYVWLLIVCLTVAAGAGITLAYSRALSDSRKRRRAELRAADSAAAITRSLAELEASHNASRLLNEFNSLLQLCVSLEESYDCLARFSLRLFPQAHGRLAVINNSRSLLEIVRRWNCTDVVNHRANEPNSCMALRSGSLFWHTPGLSALACAHVPDAEAKHYVCIPLSALGETIGILHLHFFEEGCDQRALGDQLQVLAEHTAMAIANLRLRQKLTAQSIRDPLTGQFNRRYMEESLERELYRAERSGQPLGVLMIDLDHFKQFNDLHGHDAGDIALREFAAALRDGVRKEDIVCRFGGEEFVVVAPGLSEAELVERATQMLKGIRAIRVSKHGVVLGGVTASFGAAVFPADGESASELIARADQALYRAKHTGRNRVCRYSELRTGAALEIGRSQSAD